MSDGVCAGGGPGWDSLYALLDLPWFSVATVLQKHFAAFDFVKSLSCSTA